MGSVAVPLSCSFRFLVSLSLLSSLSLLPFPISVSFRFEEGRLEEASFKNGWLEKGCGEQGCLEEGASVNTTTRKAGFEDGVEEGCLDLRGSCLEINRTKGGIYALRQNLLPTLCHLEPASLVNTSSVYKGAECEDHGSD